MSSRKGARATDLIQETNAGAEDVVTKGKGNGHTSAASRKAAYKWCGRKKVATTLDEVRPPKFMSILTASTME